jgi:predicted SnoaL-like aldol condensation-catalyzing enzyme
MSSRDLVIRATEELFDKRDVSAIERFWTSGYIEHSTIGGPGLGGLRAAAVSLPDAFHQERVRVLEDGDLVLAHSVYHGLGPTRWLHAISGVSPTQKSSSTGTRTNLGSPRTHRATR